MKTKFKLMGFFTALLALLAFMPSEVKAQCPAIRNDLNCQLQVRVDVYAPDPMGVCSIMCNSYVAGIGVMSTVPVNCGPCPIVCNVVITILTINGMPQPPTPVDYTAAPPGVSIPGPLGPCRPQPGANPRIQYTPGLFRIY